MDSTAIEQRRQIELRLWQHGAIFLIACAILIARRPDGVLHAQFYAEDGCVWFADAYNLGWWTALFHTLARYFQTLPRLAASLALLVPITSAPLVLNLIALAVQALPVGLMLSSRSQAWGTLRYRAQLAAIYLALPNCAEISYGITESQWLLAFSVFLVLVASTPTDLFSRILDVCLVVLGGMSGPFCIFLLPIALFLAWRHWDRWRWMISGVLAITSLIQTWGMLSANSHRPHYPLGATLAMLTRILGGQIYLGLLLGPNGLGFHSSPRVSLILIGIAIGGTALVVICFIRSTLPMKLMLIFAAMLFAASLADPVVHLQEGVSVWEMLAGASGIHYWFFPLLAFAWVLLWCFNSKSEILKVTAGFLLFFACVAIVRDWRHPAFPDLHFAEFAKQFESAPAGTTVKIPENPNGWSIHLVKRQYAR
jgi:hypothetical protein